ncbi:MAG: hypothetical protein JNK04_06280 [Myxococcales bacterium]|nr:hypothetical protein [Myxococcales bacterium]
MAKRLTEGPCVACNVILPSSKLSRVVIDGRTVLCCREHASKIATRMPRTYEDLRRMFLEEPDGDHPARRSKLERRGADDRRAFPPRPEGRRMEGGRRSSDREKAA